MTEATSANYAGPWYVYHRDEDGSETDHIFYDYDKAQARFDDLEDRGFFEALTLTVFPTELGQREEETDEKDSSAGCGCLIFIILLCIAGAIGALNGFHA